MTHSEANAILAQYRVGDDEVATADPEEAMREVGYAGLLLYPDGLSHVVQILDVRSVFGRTDFAVTSYGDAIVWVGADRVKPLH